ncbi:carbohydrate ABC transporter permease [Nesterenkonia alba]|uniref:carbohydrate ABC transporter permease n=1 Tax=Nesterenkonia alba TaxID=515814 RepID=UPI0003B63A08|nr:carbohydrate ABC transporter permease [Nesterenkonia alba]
MMKRLSLSNVSWWVVCSALAIIILFPIIVVLLASFKTIGELNTYPPTIWPNEVTLRNYVDLDSTSANVWRSAWNSTVVTLGTVALSLVLATLAGYGFARFKFRGDGIAFLVVLATMMMPFQALLTPLFVVLQSMGLIDSLVGLVLIYTMYVLPFTIFVMRNSMSVVPQALIDAATVDGVSRLRILGTVMLPLCWPGVVSATLFAAFMAWNEFLGALILLSSQENFTLPVILTTLQTGRYGQIDWGILNAGVVVTMVPCLLLYLALQRYYVSGLLSGSIR